MCWAGTVDIQLFKSLLTLKIKENFDNLNFTKTTKSQEITHLKSLTFRTLTKNASGLLPLATFIKIKIPQAHFRPPLTTQLSTTLVRIANPQSCVGVDPCLVLYTGRPVSPYTACPSTAMVQHDVGRTNWTGKQHRPFLLCQLLNFALCLFVRYHCFLQWILWER